MAGETLIHRSRDEIEQARLVSEQKALLDRQSDLAYAKKEGRAEGRAEGRTEGRSDERKNILELLDQGLSIDEIKKLLA